MKKLWLTLLLPLLIVVPYSCHLFDNARHYGDEVGPILICAFYLIYAFLVSTGYVSYKILTRTSKEKESDNKNIVDDTLSSETYQTYNQQNEIHISKAKVFWKLLTCYFVVPFFLTQLSLFILVFPWSSIGVAASILLIISIISGVPLFIFVIIPKAISLLNKGYFAFRNYHIIVFLLSIHPVSFIWALFISYDFFELVYLPGMLLASIPAVLLCYLSVFVFWHWEVKKFYRQFGDIGTLDNIKEIKKIFKLFLIPAYIAHFFVIPSYLIADGSFYAVPGALIIFAIHFFVFNLIVLAILRHNHEIKLREENIQKH